MRPLATDQRLPRSLSLKGDGNFQKVVLEGVRVRSGPHTLFYLPQGELRWGVRVSRKVGGAVVRNRIKRIVRECFRLNRHRFPSVGWMVFRLGKEERDHHLRESILELGDRAVELFERLKQRTSSQQRETLARPPDVASKLTGDRLER